MRFAFQLLRQSACQLGFGKRFISDEMKRSIGDLVRSNKVVLFMKGVPSQPQCRFSKAVCQVLSVQGVNEYSVVNVLENDEIRSAIKEFSQWPTIPQLFVGGEFVGGCDIVLDMYKSGQLKKLLSEKGIIGAEASPRTDEDKSE